MSRADGITKLELRFTRLTCFTMSPPSDANAGDDLFFDSNDGEPAALGFLSIAVPGSVGEAKLGVRRMPPSVDGRSCSGAAEAAVPLDSLRTVGLASPLVATTSPPEFDKADGDAGAARGEAPVRLPRPLAARAAAVGGVGGF